MMKYTVYIFIIILTLSCKQTSHTANSQIEQQINYYDAKYLEFQRLNIEKSQLYIDSILFVSNKLKYSKGIGIANLNQGLLELIKGNFNLAIQFNEKALLIFQKLKNDTLIAKTLQSLGSDYWQKGEFDKALQYHIKALDLYEGMHFENETATGYNSISMIYQSKNKLTEAEEFANKAKSIIKNKKPHRNHISILHNLANINGMKGNYTEAMILDSIGLNYCEQLNIEFNKSMFYDNLANCFFYQKDYSKAVDFHLKAIKIDSSFGNNKQLGDTYYNLAAIFEEQGLFEKAANYYNKSIELCKLTGYKTGILNALEKLSKLYFSQNKTEQAYRLLQESIMVKDSIINEKSEQRIVELQTLFDTEKKKKQIAEQNLELSRRKVWMITLFATLILTMISFYLLHNRNKLKQEQKLQQELLKEEAKRTQAIMESEENERQRLARELHDGVGQLLSATKLNLNSLESNKCTPEEKVRLQNSMNILDDSIKEIRNISHNMVPDVLLKFGLKRAIEDFVFRITQTKKIKINFECNGFEENSLEDTEKLMLYRIIQESVNNTLKYADASQMTIQLSADINEISLLMEDNGKGFDIEEVKNKNGIGLRNMQLRTDYLKGKLDIESSPKNGTTIIVEIPLP